MITTPPKSSAAIYREAAAMIERGEANYCCWAIDGMRITMSPALEFFQFVFRPHNYSLLLWWGTKYFPEHQESRILALLLAAEICERGGLEK